MLNFMIYLYTFAFIFAVLYWIFSHIKLLKYKVKMKIIDFKIDEDIISSKLKYTPAVCAYLVNFQKIGKNEICSTLLDLIARNKIKITLEKGFVQDEIGHYVLEKSNRITRVKPYEKLLMDYLFSEKKVINLTELSKLLKSKKVSKSFYKNFLILVQEDAKKYNFFDKKIGQKIYKRYTRINKIIKYILKPLFKTFLLTFVISLLLGSIVYTLENYGITSEISFILIKSFDIMSFIAGHLFGFSIVIVLPLYICILKSYYRIISCNYLSKNGEKQYSKLISFKKYLKTYSLISERGIMAVSVWERYYAYAISLGCSKKFYKQMEKMSILDDNLDKAFLEINKCIKNFLMPSLSLKTISFDKYGGSHIDY